MTDMQVRQFMRDFFERYYQKLEQIGNGIAVMRPLDEADKAMWRDDTNPNEEWKAWRLIPSTVTDQNIETLEKSIGINLPKCLNAFLTVNTTISIIQLERTPFLPRLRPSKMHGTHSW